MSDNLRTYDVASELQLIESLRDSLPPGIITTDIDHIQPYLYDASKEKSAAEPLALARPYTVEQVQRIVSFANEHRYAITPRGAGTGLAAGAVADRPSIIVSAEKLRRLEILPDLRMAVCGPGVLNIELKNAAQEHHLWYPPDPSSYASCSIGGNVATGAGGMCCVKYGVTRQYVLGVEVVLADGSVIRCGGPRIKDSAGFSLKDLIVGSEGTLGFITQILLRLIPPSQTIGTIVATYDSVEHAMEVVNRLLQGPTPAVIELVDSVVLQYMNADDLMGINPDTGALLIVQLDRQSYQHSAAPTVSERTMLVDLEHLMSEYSPQELYVTEDPDEGELFLHVRREAFVALKNVSAGAFLEDISTAVAKMPQLICGVKEIGQRHGVKICIVGHAGDGNLHVAIPADPNDPQSFQVAQQVYDEMMRYTIAEGASITGEHGIGRLKRDYLPLQLGDKLMQLHRGIKEVFDPNGIFNPGAVL